MAEGYPPHVRMIAAGRNVRTEDVALVRMVRCPLAPLAPSCQACYTVGMANDTTTEAEQFKTRDADVEFVLDGIEHITVTPDQDGFLIGAFDENMSGRGGIIDVHLLPELDDESWDRVGYYCVTVAGGPVVVTCNGSATLVETPRGTATFPQCGRLRLYAENAR